MNKIKKLQTAWTTIKLDNTKVQRPLIIQPIERTLKSGELFFNNKGKTIVVSPRLEYVYLDNRDSKIKEDSHKKSVQVRKQELMKKAEEHTAKVFGELLDELTLVPTFERVTGEELSPAGKFAASFVLPTVALKGVLYIGKGLNYAGKAANYAARMGMPALGYAPSTKYYFLPGYAGMNNFSIKSNVVDRLSNTRELFDLSPRELLSGILVNDKANSFKTIIPYSKLDSELGIKDSKRLFSTLEQYLGDEAFILDNGIAFESADEAKNTLKNLVKYLNQSNKTRIKGETPYTEEEIINMLNPERTGLKDGLVLESFYPGSHGVENWYDGKIKADPLKEIKRKLENVKKYLRTVFGRIKKEDALDLRYYNPKGRSGVLVPENLDELLSSDSSIMTLRHLLLELKNGRRYFLFTPTGYKNKLNNLGLRNSFRLKLIDENFGLSIMNNPELINNLNIQETRLPGYMAIHDKANNKLLATLKKYKPDELAELLNKELKGLNLEFSKYNIEINPFTYDDYNVYLPDNMAGILYRKGGKVKKV